MNKDIKKLLLLCMLIFSNVIATENGWKERDGTIVVYKRPPYRERNAALCSIALVSIWCSMMYYALQSKEEPVTWKDFTVFILPLAIATYFSYHWYTKRNMAQERIITLTSEGFTLEQGDGYTWKQLHSIRSRHSTYGSDLTERDRSITFVLSDNTEIKLETDDMRISNDKLINLIKRFTVVGKPIPWSPTSLRFSEEL